MAVDGYRIFDSDLPVIERADPWGRYIDPRYRGRAPTGIKLLLEEEQRRAILWDYCVRMYGSTPGVASHAQG